VDKTGLRKGGGMKDVKYVNEGAKAVKVLVDSHNQHCLNGLCDLDHALRQDGVVSTGARINNNGGYLMHFYGGQSLINSLPIIQSIVQGVDENATITVFNVSKPQPSTV